MVNLCPSCGQAPAFLRSINEYTKGCDQHSKSYQDAARREHNNVSIDVSKAEQVFARSWKSGQANNY